MLFQCRPISLHWGFSAQFLHTRKWPWLWSHSCHVIIFFWWASISEGDFVMFVGRQIFYHVDCAVIYLFSFGELEYWLNFDCLLGLLCQNLGIHLAFQCFFVHCVWVSSECLSFSVRINQQLHLHFHDFQVAKICVIEHRMVIGYYICHYLLPLLGNLWH